MIDTGSRAALSKFVWLAHDVTGGGKILATPTCVDRETGAHIFGASFKGGWFVLKKPATFFCGGRSFGLLPGDSRLFRLVDESSFR